MSIIRRYKKEKTATVFNEKTNDQMQILILTFQN